MSCQGNEEKCWVSLILRIAIASLFFAAGVNKFVGGVENVSGFFASKFEATWLPMLMVKPFGSIIAYLEIALSVWLIIGLRLRAAWVVTSLTMIALAFGMAVAKEYASAAHNYFYLVLCCVGLLMSPYDRLSVDGFSKKEGS